MPEGRIAIYQSVMTGQSDQSLRQRLDATVNNTGNLLFQEAVLRQIKFDHLVHDIKNVPKSADTLILTLANFMRSTLELDDFAADLDHCHCDNIILIGVGAQSYDYDIRADQLSPSAHRILSIAAERSKSIGLRGQYSAQVLEKHGFQNFDIIGCPSVFYNLRSDAPYLNIHRDKSNTSGVVIHTTASGYFRDKIAALLAFGLRHDCDYMLQNEHEIITLLSPEDASPEELEKAQYFLSYYRPSDMSEVKIAAWFRANSKIFFSTDSWSHHLSRKSLAIGARFHGNIAALLANTPSITLYFDSRTREMCDYLNLPSMPMECFSADMELDRLIDLGRYDGFLQSYPQKYANYVDFLNKNRIPHILMQNPDHKRTPDTTAPFDLSPENKVKFGALLQYFSDRGMKLDADDLKHIANRLWTIRPAADRKRIEAGQSLPDAFDPNGASP